MRRLLAAAVLVAVVLVGVAGPAQAAGGLPEADEVPPVEEAAPAAPEVPIEPVTGANGSSVEVSVTDVQRAAQAVPGWRPMPVALAPPLVRYVRAEACGVMSAGAGYAWPCSDGRVVDHTDVCGEAPVLLPLWRQTRATPADLWSDWVMVEDLSCAGGPVPSGEQVLSEFRRLPIVPSVLTVQPDRGWVLVNVETIAFTDLVPQVLSATVLGVQVTFTVTPSTFTWDYGEKVFTTTSPGHPYPNQDVSYPYAEPGTGQVMLTTTWAATYTVGEDPTSRPVPGTATTVTTSPQFEVREVSAHLTRGNCNQYPDDPGC